MNSLFLLNETYTNGYRGDVLIVISLFAILSGILVIISKNPIVSVLFLIGLVYVGAVSILFLFILMLINVRLSELLSNPNNSIPLAILIAISFNYPVYQILPNSITSFNGNTFYSNTTLGDTLYYNSNNLIKLSKLTNTKLDNDKIPFVTSKI
jgi:NADH-ubiquinone oxidoreductase chain 6